MDRALETLRPTAVVLNQPSADDLFRTSDVDSIVVCARTLCPFTCDTILSMNLSLPIVTISRNDKLLVYLKRRRDVWHTLSAPSFRARGEFLRKDEPMYEFKLSDVDGKAVYVLFQIKQNARVFQDLSAHTSWSRATVTGKKLAVARKRFLLRFVARAAVYMPVDSTTVLSGLGYVRYSPEGTYHIPTNEYGEYTQHLASLLRRKSLVRHCGIRYIRFYCALHGLRIPCAIAQNTCASVANVDHSHVDVVQIHRADNIGFTNNNIAIIKLSGWSHDTLSEVLRRRLTLKGKLQKYRFGCLADYGHFRKHCVLQSEPCVTFVQAYNSAAKMARPSQTSLLACSVLCRFFFSEGECSMTPLATSALQYALHLVSFALHHVRQNQVLRMEEVLTMDSLTLDVPMSMEMERLGCFDDRWGYASNELFDAGLVYRLHNWSRYFDDVIGNDIRFLKALLSTDNLEVLLTTSSVGNSLVSTALRADFRIQYFVHGNSFSFNYQLLRLMFCNANESASVRDGVVRLRSLTDADHGDAIFPLYCTRVPARIMSAITCLWAVRHTIDDDVVDDATAYVMVSLSVWAYTHSIAFATSVHPTIAQYKTQATDTFLNYPNVFSIETFLTRVFRAPRSVKTTILTKSRTPASIVDQLISAKRATPFILTLRMTMPLTDDRLPTEDLRLFFQNHVRMFPVCLLESSRNDAWFVVAPAAGERRSHLSFKRKKLVQGVAKAVHHIKTGRLHRIGEVLKVAKHLESSLHEKVVAPSSTGAYQRIHTSPPDEPISPSGPPRKKRYLKSTKRVKRIIYWCSDQEDEQSTASSQPVLRRSQRLRDRATHSSQTSAHASSDANETRAQSPVRAFYDGPSTSKGTPLGPDSYALQHHVVVASVHQPEDSDSS